MFEICTKQTCSLIHMTMNIIHEAIPIIIMFQSVTNFFIANLALADVIIGLFSIPFQFQAALLQRWNLPEFLCPFCPFFQVLKYWGEYFPKHCYSQNLSVNASIFTLTAIAVDRYKAIMYPLKSHASKSRTKVIILIIWIVSTILAVPMAIAFRAQVSFSLKIIADFNISDGCNRFAAMCTIQYRDWVLHLV